MNIEVDFDRSRRVTAWAGQNKSGSTSASALAEQIRQLAERIRADDYLVLRLDTLGSRTQDEVAVVLKSNTIGGLDSTLIQQIAPIATAHMAKSLVPLVRFRSLARLQCLQHFVVELPARQGLDDALGGRDCICLPVKLGGLGNGLMLFFGRSLDLDGRELFALHRDGYGVFKGLLRLELKRSAPRQNLNDRELECLQLAGEGLKSELIAERLSLSVHTINAYLGTATAKLDSVNRIQAIAKAIRLGYLA